MQNDLTPYTPFFVFGAWFFTVCLLIFLRSFPSSKIVKKFGKPYAHFTTQPCWNSIPIRNGKHVDMDFYPEFVVVSSGKKEFIFDRSFKDYCFLGSYFVFVLQIDAPDFKMQISITRKQKKLLMDFLDTY